MGGWSKHLLIQRADSEGKQAEAEVVPSSSLVEFEVMVDFEVGVEVEVGIGVEVWVEGEIGVEVEVGVGVGGVGVGVGPTFSVRWLEIWRVKLISTQVLVLVEVGVELGKNRNCKINTIS